MSVTCSQKSVVSVVSCRFRNFFTTTCYQLVADLLATSRHVKVVCRVANKSTRSWQLLHLRGSYGETCIMDFGHEPRSRHGMSAFKGPGVQQVTVAIPSPSRRRREPGARRPASAATVNIARRVGSGRMPSSTTPWNIILHRHSSFRSLLST